MTDEEMYARIKVAYEQLGKVHTAMCRRHPRREDSEIVYDVHDILNAILNLEVKLGMLKREEDAQ